MSKKYLKNEKGIVRAVTSENLQLEKPLGNEHYDIEVHNRNMDKIDGAIQEVKSKIDGLELVASNVKMSDGSTVEDTVSANKTSILEHEVEIENLKQSVSNGKQLVASAITDKGINTLATDTFEAMQNKILNIETGVPKWLIGKTNVWDKSGASMKSVRRSHASVVVGNKIYVLGGSDSTNTSVDCYDTLKNTWTSKAPMPTGKATPTAFSIGTKIYCIAGNVNECYDTISNSWTTKNNLLTSRNEMKAHVVNNIAYVIGGQYRITTNECYDHISDTWSTKESMPNGRYKFASSVVGNNIHCIGGDNGTGICTDYHEVYDTTSDTWSTKPVMPNKRSSCGCTSVGNKIYVMGGYFGNGYGYYKQNDCYDVSTNTWSTKTDMTSARYGHTCDYINGVIFCMGGISVNGNAVLSTNECYLP